MRDARVIVIGGSAGGLEPLRTILAGLPADLAASVLIAVHTAPDGPGLLPGLLGPSCRLPIAHGIDGEPLRAGRIYFAPPDHHLLIDGEVVRLSRGPKENYSRPSIDMLFRSAAQAFGRRVIGVVLSGRLDDGTAGLWAIKQRGGTTIVQDPAEAIEPSMPRGARAHVEIDRCLPAGEIAGALVRATLPASSDP